MPKPIPSFVRRLGTHGARSELETLLRAFQRNGYDIEDEHLGDVVDLLVAHRDNARALVRELVDDRECDVGLIDGVMSCATHGGEYPCTHERARHAIEGWNDEIENERYQKASAAKT